jgi:hypothetical protein
MALWVARPSSGEDKGESMSGKLPSRRLLGCIQRTVTATGMLLHWLRNVELKEEKKAAC